ncbi:MAG: tRNA (5-methylaminomethyl-2-thiouridine)(34)-methyltransferase MnmD [Chitinophagaceae bacterium]|nr:tRNA (5-methylaminomethyl-2-thiouridine)(34)-methyltransferase MnmD [Chitinophagaceae bacterium]
MERKLFETRDGSHSIAIPELQVMYHSVHGAIQESQHIFIHAGLEKAVEEKPGRPLRILEMGLGTGLNALLTAIYSSAKQISVEYITVEKFPIDAAMAAALNYSSKLEADEWQPLFLKLHSCATSEMHPLTANFSFRKFHTDIMDLPATVKDVDLIYFDAFAPAAQPELWNIEVFEHLGSRCNPGAILTTYCSKGWVRRNLEAAGWKVEKIPGPWGKREIVRAHALRANV